jgi:hypothetical protein
LKTSAAASASGITVEDPMIVTSSGSASQGERDTNERQTSKIIIIFVINPTTRELSGQICKPIVIAQSDRSHIM